MAMIAMMMEEVSISETSVSFFETTRHNIPEDNNQSSFAFVSFVLFPPFSLYFCI
jgi:hypothetical protein